MLASYALTHRAWFALSPLLLTGALLCFAELTCLLLCLPTPSSPAEMCDTCAMRNEVLPSLESFSMRWKLPKIHFLFYENFYRPAIGDTVWKRRITENRRFGTMIAEAYASASLRNQYFAWLYEYKADNPHINLRTEYDLQETQGASATEDSQENRQEQGVNLFCGELDLVEVSVPTHPASTTPADDSSSYEDESEQQEEPRDQFEILSGRGETADAHKAAREHDQAILKELKRQLDADQGENNTSSGTESGNVSKEANYSKMSAKLAEISSQPAAMSLKERDQRKRKSMTELRDFTTTARKSKKGRKELQGWTKAGQRYVYKVLGEINQDEQSGIRKKWESVYLKLRKAAQQDDGDNDDDDEEEFVMNPNLLYAEV